MNAISFKLSGKTAFFKKPDVNAYANFTYNNIHKPALLGLLGAILGLSGYNKLFEKNRDFKKDDLGYDNSYPEFYEKLKDFKVCIIPLAKNGYFSKKIQIFNNSVGYASFEAGGNLIVRQQWLENPAWRVMILENQSEEFANLKVFLEKQKAIFIPYLGSNDHFAKIENFENIKLKDQNQNRNFIDSLFICEDKPDGFCEEHEEPFSFVEISPISLEKQTHIYEYKKLCFTNIELSDIKDCYSLDDKNYAFI